MHAALYERGREKVQEAPQLYVDFDVEADGIAGFGSLLSVGGITPWGDEFYRELRPTSDVWIPENRQFCEEHGLQRERLLDEGVEPAVAMRELVEWTEYHRLKYGKIGTVLTAFNASFDYPWVDLEMLKAGIISPYGVAGFCVKSMALGIAVQKGYDWRATAKSRLPREIVPDGDFTHNALEDARYQQAMHFALVGLLDMLMTQEVSEEETADTKVRGWHRAVGGSGEYLFECGRCTNGRDCMEYETLYLTNEQAAQYNDGGR